jgi:tRNAThr (cytosine32-N3)-methyltransferase
MHDAARRLIDRAHAADPAGRETAYADGVEAWLLRLVPDADPVLRLAARCQHLERWTLPRDAYPMDKPGYHAWRTEQYRRMGARAKVLCLEAGLPQADAERIEAIVAKKRLKHPDGQAIEDAACLHFLNQEIAGFAATHSEYTPEKYIDILRKTMRKMSPAARDQALALPLPEPFAGLVRAAAEGLRNQPSA